MYHLKSSFKDYFKILQIDSTACSEVIHAAYKALIKKYHPDYSASYHEKAVLLNEAFEVLSDQSKKEEYLENYQKFAPKSQVVVKEIEKGASYISKRSELNEKEYLLNQREEELSKKELQLKMKMKLFSEISKYSDLSKQNEEEFSDLNKLITDFSDDFRSNKLPELIERIRALGSERFYVISKLLSSKLSLAQEALLYEILFEKKDEKAFDLLDGAFKFRKLYPVLFQWILDEDLRKYKNKFAVTVSQMVFTLDHNSELLPVILEIYKKMFSKTELLELLNKIYKLFKKNKITQSIYSSLLLNFLLTIKDLDSEILFPNLKEDFKDEKNELICNALDSLKEGA